MTYDEFKAAYIAAFNGMMKYAPDQVGSQVFAEKMAKLSDDYPEFEAQLESKEVAHYDNR